MDLDLSKLREMHPELPMSVASSMSERAALALQRNGHAPGVRLTMELIHSPAIAVIFVA